MKRFFPPFAAALALALAAAAPSQADTIVWYNWTNTPAQIPFVPQFPQSPGQLGTGGVNLQDLDTNAIPADTTIGTGAPAVNLQVISTAQGVSKTWPQGVDMIPTNGGNYTLTLKLYAQDPSKVKGQTPVTVSFTGMLQGTATALTAKLTNAITSATDWNGTVHHYTLVGGQNTPGQVFAMAMVGGKPVMISYDPTHGFAESGNPEEHAFGAISFDIGGSPGTVGNPTPEPSSMVLGCLGLSFVGGVVWRARRRKLAALKAAA
jgi:hypothetical protein